MELDDQLKLGHLLLYDRKCRVCGNTKNMLDGFYRTRKCKECTKKRVKKGSDVWEYPDW